MAAKKKAPAASYVEAEAKTDDVNVNLNEGGLLVTKPPQVERGGAEDSGASPDSDSSGHDEVMAQFEKQAPGIEISESTSHDPEDSPAGCLISIGRLYNDMGILSAAISKHLPAIADQVELHAFLMRVQTSCGEFRHAAENSFDSMSDELVEAFHQAIG